MSRPDALDRLRDRHELYEPDDPAGVNETKGLSMAQGQPGLNRREAAAWVTRRTGARVDHTTLRNWERGGLLRNQRPGRRSPCAYNVADLIRAEILATLRRDGAPLQRIKRALRELRTLILDVIDRPGAWRIAVTPAGDVVRIEDRTTVLELTTRTPGQYLFLDVAEIARAAGVAVRRTAAA